MAATDPPLTSADLADLKAKAKAATPGRWVVYNETDVWTVDDKPIACTDFGDVTEFAKNNVAHIAAANPETILRLIDMVERRDEVIEDAVETLEAMDLHVDNPLYDRLRAILEPPSEALSTTEPQK